MEEKEFSILIRREQEVVVTVKAVSESEAYDKVFNQMDIPESDWTTQYPIDWEFVGEHLEEEFERITRGG